MKTMNRLFLLSLCATVALALGCARTDVRTAVIKTPGITAADLPRIKQAFVLPAADGLPARVCDGVHKDTIVCDPAAETVTIVYDSMKTAQANLRCQLEQAGFKVVHPGQVDGVAGYINAKSK